MTDTEIPVRVKQMRHEADTVVSVEFETLDGSDLPQAAPGAHVDVVLNDGLRRSYSLTREITGGARCTVAVHRAPDSKGGSAHVHDILRVGDRIALSRPRNNFPLAGGAEASVFVAGGIGITPILAMLRHLTRNGRPWELHYAARRRGAAAFRAEITDLAAAAGGNATVTWHFDDEQGGALINIPAILAAHPGAHVYCCGPEPMLVAFEDATAGLPRDRVHVERFSAAEEAARDGGFELVLQRSGKTLQVEPGQTILDVLIANKVPVSFSCMEGACGTCETRVIEGRPDHRDAILTEEERARNDTMMVCCSGSRSDRLVLDL
ncbi:PDR/VanB family oxidoreductase [Oceanicella sp. SM1341]|uniref:PDR/VanB family oxidoreductase n=1 Tax=Oceanicella sp. SM1341 TaxID=1548889 RepID=UPI000E4BCD3D|nr:PDR/VanB family oxidoreductase [Oceanicella sp. SM1341]